VTHRVVITGFGAVTGRVSGGTPALAAALTSPPITPLLAPPPVSGFLDESEARRLSRACQFAVASARLALADAGVPAERHLGLVLGTEFGDLRSTMDFADGYLARGHGGLSPLLFPNTVMNAMAATAAIAVAAREQSLTLIAPDVAGELAIARAAATVAGGRADMVLAGGVDQTDASLTAILRDFGVAEARTDGAALVVLEARESALARGARILGEIGGVAWRALPARPYGVGRSTGSPALGAALRAGGVTAGDIRWLYDSTSGDVGRAAWEQSVLDQRFGARRPPAVSLAPLFGHSAAVGAIRVAAAAWTARSRLLPAPSRQRVEAGPGLVHALARGGSEVALIVLE
jgi:3-oxoacyl-[acyl-carrier-protein] synthase II